MSESSSNAQVLRQQAYLQAMGIERWLPRQALPGAAASATWVDDFVWPAVAEEVWADEAFADAPDDVRPSLTAPLADMTGAATSVASGERARASALAAVSADLQAHSPKTPNSPEPVQSLNRVQTHETASQLSPSPPAEQALISPPVEATERTPPVQTEAEFKLALTPRFSLVLISLGDVLWIDTLPQHARRGFSPAHLRLLQGLSTAMGVTDKVAEATPIRHDWPAFAGSALDQSASEAMKSVRRRIERQLEFSPARAVILCGEAAAQWVLERDEALSALRGLVFHLRPGVRALATYSLTEMLQLPEMIKPDVWKDLQALHKAMQVSTER